MGAIAARKRNRLDNVRRVLAIEFLTAAQALDVRQKSSWAKLRRRSMIGLEREYLP